MQVSIIIVNFNGIEHIPSCLNSIYKFNSEQYEIIIVDNASNDGSVEYLQKNYPDVKLIINKENQGFAAGNNLGARYASGKYILLLNNDTLLLGTINGVVELFEEHDELGVVGIKMLGQGGEYRFSCGYFPSPLRLIKFSTIYKKSGFFRDGKFPANPKAFYPVDWIEGSFLLTSRSLWNRLDGLDENYFMYMEDVDYCRRIQQLGYKTVYFPNVSYIHYGGFTNTRNYMLIEGIMRYHDKFSGTTISFLVNMILTCGLFLRIFLYSIIKKKSTW